jgi:hypothetical protein
MKCTSNAVLVTIIYDAKASKVDKLHASTGILAWKIQTFLLLKYFDTVQISESLGMPQLPNISFPRFFLVQIFLHFQP